MIYSVCIDNQGLKTIAPIQIGWETPYLNLLFDKAKADEKGFAAKNGKYCQLYDTDDSFRTTILDVILDDQDHIAELSMSKYRQASFNHGKNSSTELKVSAADIKAYTAQLQEVITDPSEKELEELLSGLQQSDFGKQRKMLVKGNDVSLLDQNGEKQKIKRKTLLKAIQISHAYLEILHNDRVFELCPKDFPAEIRPVLREILSFVDPGKYYRYDALRNEMEMRELVALAEPNYPMLRQAVVRGDLEGVRQLAAYARLVPKENPEGSPLYHAVKGNRLDVAEILLDNGAYVLEMERDGSRFPLLVAYQNGNRDMVRLIVQYHGAKVKTSSVTKNNTEEFLKECARNKDAEVLEWIAPEAFTEDSRTWLKPEWFPDLDRDTILGLTNCKGIRMAWDVDQIRPVYEEKDLDLCRRMMRQGTSKLVVEFFIAQNEYEMFEIAVQHCNDLNINGVFGPVYERGGKWYDTLCEKVSSLPLRMNSYFADMLNHGEVERYLQIMEKLDDRFVGVNGYMLWPDKVTDPKLYLELVRAYLKKKQPCAERQNFLEDIIRYFGDGQLAADYYKAYPLRTEKEWDYYVRTELFPKYVRTSKEINPYAAAEMVRTFFAQNMEHKEQMAFEFLCDLIRESSRRFQNKIEKEEELGFQEKRCLQLLRVLLSCVPLHVLDAEFKKNYGKYGIESAYQYAAKPEQNIRSLPFLEELKGNP